MESRSASLSEEADRAAAAGDLHRATDLLREAAEGEPGDPALLLKLAAMHRATGAVPAALDAVHGALALAPRDFMALLMRASLLDRLNDPSADEAWTHALAQKPEGDLPPQVAAVAARAEQRVEAWLDQRDQRMKAAMADAEAKADEDQAARMARFRSNVLRRTHPYHSEPTHFHYPGLVEREFHPRRRFPWIDAMESATDIIAAELCEVMAAERAELVPYIQSEDFQPLDQWRSLNNNPDWTAIHLVRNGKRIENNARHCPRTMALLDGLPQPQIRGASPNAMFSLLAPNTAIPPHVGINNTRLVCHLPLVVPEGCWFRVGAETRLWKRGEAFVFDDTIEHEAMNPTAELRVVFIFDVWHPDLDDAEREAAAALIGVDLTAAAGGL